MSFRLAMIQMAVEAGSKHRNVAHAVELIDQARAGGADVALLPEALDCGWTHPSSHHDAEPIPGGDSFGSISQSAKRNNMVVCCGLTERDGNNVYNTAVLINSNGDLLHRHRKINELDIGHSFYGPGGSLGICKTRFATIGILICADAFARDETLLRSLGYMGADIILSPCAWATPPGHNPERDPSCVIWHRSYKPVATDFDVYVAGVSCVGLMTDGPWKGYNCIGNSLLYAPGGKLLACGPHGKDEEVILYADIEPTARPARGTQWAQRWESQKNV